MQAQAKQAGPQADPRLKELDGRLTKLEERKAQVQPALTLTLTSP